MRDKTWTIRLAEWLPGDTGSELPEDRGFDEKMNQLENSEAKNGLNELSLEAAGNLWDRPSSYTGHGLGGGEDV